MDILPQALINRRCRHPRRRPDGGNARCCLYENTNLGVIKDVPEKAAVIGGGFTAIDRARSSPRLGAKEVSIIYRRTLEEMPAGEIEVGMAEEEGIKIHYLTSPVRIIGGHDKQVTHLECIKTGSESQMTRDAGRPIPIEGSTSHCL